MAAVLHDDWLNVQLATHQFRGSFAHAAGPHRFILGRRRALRVAALAMWHRAPLRLRATAAWALASPRRIFAGMFRPAFRVSSPTAFDKLFHPRIGVDWLPWLVLLPRHHDARRLRTADLAALVLALAASSRGVPAATVGRECRRDEPLVARRQTSACWRSGSALFAALWLTFALGRRSGQPLVRSGLLLIAALGSLSPSRLRLDHLRRTHRHRRRHSAGDDRRRLVTGYIAAGPSSAAGPSPSRSGPDPARPLLRPHHRQRRPLTVLARRLRWLAPSPSPGEGRGEGGLDLAGQPSLSAPPYTIIPFALAAASAIATAKPPTPTAKFPAKSVHASVFCAIGR